MKWSIPRVNKTIQTLLIFDRVHSALLFPVCKDLARLECQNIDVKSILVYLGTRFLWRYTLYDGNAYYYFYVKVSHYWMKSESHHPHSAEYFINCFWVSIDIVPPECLSELRICRVDDW